MASNDLAGLPIPPDSIAASLPAPPDSVHGSPPGYAESLARGVAQGGTLGFADELVGAGSALVDAANPGGQNDLLHKAAMLNPVILPGTLAQAGANLATGNTSISDIVKNYIQHRDDFRRGDEAAHKANPKTFLGGQLGGGIATAFIPGLNIGKAATLTGRIAGAAGLGATAALGSSNADLTQGQYGQAAKDTAIGAATGAALQPVMEKVVAPAVGYVSGKAGNLAGFMGKKALNAAFDTPESLTEGYLANPEAYNKALPTQGVAQKLADTLGDVRNDTGPAAEAALSSLSTERTPNEGFAVKDAIQTLRKFDDPSTQKLADALEQQYAERAPGLGAEARPTTITRKMQFVPGEDPTDLTSGFRQIGETPQNGGLISPTSRPIRGYFSPEEGDPFTKALSERRIEGIPPTSEEANFLTEREMHEVKKALQDAAGNWKNPLPTSEMAKARLASGDINQKLKSQNMDYATAMSDLAQNIQAKQGLAQKFSLQPDYSGANESGFTFSDRTLSAIKDIVRGNKVDRARVLESLKEQGYGDLADDVEKSLGKAYFEGQGATNGGRRVYAGTALGAAAGKGIGHFLQSTGFPGAETIGTYAGAALGAGTGAAMDKYGPQVAKKALDATVLMQSLSKNPAAQKFVGAIKNAASQGQGALAATHFILSQTEPAYQEAVNGGQ